MSDKARGPPAPPIFRTTGQALGEEIGMETTDTRATAFGRVLSRLMEARGIPAEPEEIRALAERSGFDGDAFLALATSEDAPDVGHLSGLAREMGLTEPERVALAEAYVFGRDGIADLIRRGDTFNDAHALALEHGEGLYPVARKRILDLLGAERDAAWAEAKRLKAELGAKAKRLKAELGAKAGG
jgi:hypothetical protein